MAFKAMSCEGVGSSKCSSVRWLHLTLEHLGQTPKQYVPENVTDNIYRFLLVKLLNKYVTCKLLLL